MPELLSKQWFAWRLSNAQAMSGQHMICSETLVGGEQPHRVSGF
jgi:hypothetical protein